jgi:Skp family chaperone for outer membrane proteins
MTKIQKYIAIFILICAASFTFWGIYAPVKVMAQPVQIGIINAAHIKGQSKRFKLYEDDVLQKSNALRDLVAAKEADFRKKYAHMQDVISDKKNRKATIDDLKKDFQKKVAEFEKELQDLKEKLLHDISEGRDNLEKELGDIIEKIAKENGFNIILNSFVDDKKLVMYAEKSFDISNLVVERLDASIKN